MSTITLPPAEVRSEEPLAIVTCMCGKPHPCPDHGAWARPVAEQLALLDPRQTLPCNCGPLRHLRGCHVHGPQPREHAVLCSRCMGPTLNLNDICDRCMGIKW